MQIRKELVIIVVISILLNTLQVNILAEGLETTEIANGIEETIELESKELVVIELEEGIKQIEEMKIKEQEIKEIEYQEVVYEVEDNITEDDNQIREQQPSTNIVGPVNIVTPVSLEVKDTRYKDKNIIGYVVENKSEFPIKLKGLHIISKNGWELTDYNTDFKNIRLGQKKFGLRVESEVIRNNYIDYNKENFIIPPFSLEKLDMDIKIAKQLNGVSESIFTVMLDVEPILPEIENIRVIDLYEELEITEDIEIKDLEEVAEIQDIERIDLEEVLEIIDDIETNIDEEIKDLEEVPEVEEIEYIDARVYYKRLNRLEREVEDLIIDLEFYNYITREELREYKWLINDYKLIMDKFSEEIENIRYEFDRVDLSNLTSKIEILFDDLDYIEWLLYSIPEKVNLEEIQNPTESIEPVVQEETIESENENVPLVEEELQEVEEIVVESEQESNEESIITEIEEEIELPHEPSIELELGLEIDNDIKAFITDEPIDEGSFTSLEVD